MRLQVQLPGLAALMEKLLDVKQACELLGISEATLYRIIRRNEVTIVKLRNRTLFRLADLDELVERHRHLFQAEKEPE